VDHREEAESLRLGREETVVSYDENCRGDPAVSEVPWRVDDDPIRATIRP
jgi:hypothetical protein